ncbi:MAG TPA: ATP-binding protein [Steroidobacter sp.]|uniref:ATP-binding protein n=1 Tax=Steroidobacter sp. TaxID=1978227 RepID=UPI002EDBA89B
MTEVPLQTAPSFLLSIDEATRALADPSEIMQVTAALLVRHLGVNRCAYAEVEGELDAFEVTADYCEGVPSVVGRYYFSDLSAECLRSMQAGEPYVVEDSATDQRTAGMQAIYRQLQVRAVICMPLLKAGRLVAALMLQSNRPRRWQREEIDLVRLVASRCWESIERARIERRLKQVINEKHDRVGQAHSAELTAPDRQFAQLVAGVADCAIYMLDLDGRVASWNVGAERIKGYEADEIIGRHFSQFYSIEDRAAGLPERSLSLVATQGKFESEGWRVRKDGSRFWANVLIDPIYDTDRRLVGYAKITRDMTERRLMQEQLNQAQKMEAVGQLTGGVAHDFNNLLTVILGNLDTVQRRAPADDMRSQRALEHAMRGAQRAAALTHQLLAFARRQSLNPKPTSVNQLVTALLELIRRTLPEGIAVQSRISGVVGHVSVDANQMESALLNLVLNARDAMHAGGTLTIETEMVELGAEETWHLGDLQPGPHAIISVSDTGVGMSSEVMTRAFDPFFTTKPLGQGTGLGLSQVFGFVKQSGGTVKLQSEVGKGTTVKVYLPRVSAASAARSDGRDKDVPRARGSETILVVEDEEDVRSYSVECLQELGFSVLQACDASSALRLIPAHPEIRLLFTDVGLPRMNGRELAEEARRMRPELPVLFTTGYAQDAMFQQGKLDPNAELLTKPFNRAQLAERVRYLLDA